MKRPIAFVVAVIAMLLSVGGALATPGTGVVGPVRARVTFDAVSTSNSAGREAVFQELTIAPGGHTGWHSHPGGTIILVESGTFTIYNDACTPTVVAAGRGLVEGGGQVQLARNNSTTEPLVLSVVYVDVPPAAPVRSDATAPACALGAGLPTVAAGSGVSSNVIVSRATFAAAQSITGADERDAVIQEVTIAPGGHTGWHSHPGTTVILVKSGTFSFYSAADCRAQRFAAGQGLVEPGGGVQLARNEGTEPLVVYVAYFDVPVGGSFRTDAPEPGNCTGLAAVPSAPSAPTEAPSAPPLPATSMTARTPTSVSPFAAILLLAFSAGLLAWRFALVRNRR